MNLLIFFYLLLFSKEIEVKISFSENNTLNNYTIINNTKLISKFNINSILNSTCACNFNNDIYYEGKNTFSSNFTIINNNSKEEIKNVKLLTNNNKFKSYYLLTPKNKEEYEIKIKTLCRLDDTIESNYKKAEFNLLQTSHYEYNNNDNYAILNFSFGFKNEKYSFSYIKFCNSESPYLSMFSCAIIFCVALIYLIFSTYVQLGQKIVQEINEEMNIQWYHGIFFICLGSCMLLIIYFFFDYIIYIFNGLVAFQCFICLQITLEFFIEKHIKRINPELLSKKYYNKLKLHNILSIIISLILVIIYFFNKHWIMNNIMAFGLVFTILSLILFKSFKVCFVFLICIFLYDTFWVFYSENIFSGNVMETTATKVNLPIKLEMPILFSTNPIKDCMLLGLGDIALPGMIVKYCKRFDQISIRLRKKNGYYIFSLILYIISVIIAMICMFVFKHGQPVLFYISPAFIFGLIGKSIYQDQFIDFWNGIELPPQNDKDNNKYTREINNENDKDNKNKKESEKIGEGEKLEMANE